MALAIVAGCGVEPSGDPEGGSTTASDNDGSGTTEAVADTGDGTESSGALPEATSSSGTAGTGESTGSDTGEPPPDCSFGTCVTACSGTTLEEGAGGRCECDSEPTPPGYVGCDLEEPCGTGDTVCVIESIRDGVVGRYRLEPSSFDGTYILDYEVFAPGRARVHEFGWTHDCCGGVGVNVSGRHHHVQDTLAADDPAWDDCIANLDPGTVPTCLDPDVLLIGACEPIDVECPALAVHLTPDGIEASTSAT